MKIVFVTRWFSHQMGYIENCLPYAMARLGHEVHIVTSTAQVYYNADFYKRSYQSYLGDPVVAAGTTFEDGVYLHRLPFRSYKTQLIINGLTKKINELRPDVVQVFEHIAIDTFRIAVNRIFNSYKFYTANHVVLSVFTQARDWNKLSLLQKLKMKLFAWLPGKLCAVMIKKCYVVTQDAGYIAHRFLGVPQSKVTVNTLGVDTRFFHPFESAIDKQKARISLGFSEKDIVCLYTGRFTKEKNPLLAATVIQQLNEKGYPFKGLFIGEGEQKAAIAKLSASTVIDFVHYPQLPFYYKVADIGVWPGQESTSQLDAVASGTNLILTDAIGAYALVDNNDANDDRPKIVSRFYKHFDQNDLSAVLLSLQDETERKRLQQKGGEEITVKYSWDAIAKRRVKEYEMD